MKSYKYIARDSSGTRKEGAKQANSSNDVVAWLREQDLTPVSVSELSAAVKQAPRQKGRQKRIKSADLSALCWQLTTMVEGGISITTALETIADDIENIQLRRILQQTLEKMTRGEPFSAAISEYPKVFNHLSCAMILAGETGGNLPEALRRLAEHFDTRDKLSKKVKGAMAYPIFVVSFIVLIVIAIMTFIIPRFQLIFKQFRGELPAFTQGFMQVCNMFRYNLHYIIGLVFLVVVSTILT